MAVPKGVRGSLLLLTNFRTWLAKATATLKSQGKPARFKIVELKN